ncbi:heat-shock protein [Pigmentiphaga sp. NML080357]|uniref:Hsp70 family protein n=1 Tax=Pigmentiphaga sp. NML080357 TaxID=2008675 RepID=UPI000B42248A|nr:Hsp70 family protein [Pigmentiphaga sp. NML080357]OVZ61759.1 heat-shock protein [Pigmentiphaga sp. NML080357]
MISNACGVDFGTSNSTVGWCRPHAASPLLQLEAGKPTLPSAVFFHAEDSEVSFGRAAVQDYLEGYDGRLMRALKSLLGTPLMEGHTEVQGRALPFRTLLTRFIAELKHRAERAAGRAFDRAVFGRPVFFVDDDSAADAAAQDTLGEIARSVGFRHVEFQYEPMAAAFDYESRVGAEELVLVVDIGGGTSDFTLIRLGPARSGRADRRDDILANGGVHIGGTDFDKYLNLRTAMPLLGLGSRLVTGKDMPSTPYFNLASWHTINQVYARKSVAMLSDLYHESAEKEKLARLLELVKQRTGHWVAFQVEEAKIALGDSPTVRMDLERIEPGLACEITRRDLDSAIDHLVARIEQTLAGLLRSAGIPASAVDTIFFTGGSSSVPLLRERVSTLLPAARQVQGDAFGSIGTGLALDAARRLG